MGKTIKHSNMLQPNPGFDCEGFHYFHFVCRGCTMMRNRVDVWNGFASSIWDDFNREIDNSYLSLEEEPNNRYDPNAIMVVCRGEFFGTVGYVGKEFTTDVKNILSKSIAYRVDVVDENEIGNREVTLVLTWTDNPNYRDDMKSSDAERLRRKLLGLPVTKKLRYMERIVGGFAERPVVAYDIEKFYPISECYSLILKLDNDQVVRILSPYFAEMQKPSFADDMRNGSFG